MERLMNEITALCKESEGGGEGIGEDLSPVMECDENRNCGRWKR